MLAGALPVVRSLDSLQFAPVILGVLLYAARARTLAGRGRAVRPARALCFYGGIVVLVVAFASPLERLGEERFFSAHMGQHLLIGDVAAILVVLGLTGPMLGPLLSLPGVGRLRALASPLVAVPLWAVNLYAWHAPPLYDGALEHQAVHALQHGCFLVAGTLLWAALLEPLPGPAWFGSGWKAVFALGAGAGAAVLANVFIWHGTVIYERYSSLTDQRLGGAIMLLEGSAVTLSAFAWFFLRWMRDTEARQRMMDEGRDPAAAARAVRYGRVEAK